MTPLVFLLCFFQVVVSTGGTLPSGRESTCIFHAVPSVSKSTTGSTWTGDSVICDYLWFHSSMWSNVLSGIKEENDLSTWFKIAVFSSKRLLLSALILKVLFAAKPYFLPLVSSETAGGNIQPFHFVSFKLLLVALSLMDRIRLYICKTLSNHKVRKFWQKIIFTVNYMPNVTKSHHSITDLKDKYSVLWHPS